MFASAALQAFVVISLSVLAFGGDRYKMKLAGSGAGATASSGGSGGVEYGDLDDAAINKEIVSCAPLLAQKVKLSLTDKCPHEEELTVESQCRNRYDGTEVSKLTIQCTWPDPREGLAYSDDLTAALLTACDNPDTKESKQHVVLEMLDRLCADAAELRGKPAETFQKQLAALITPQKLQATGFRPPPLVKLTLGKFLIGVEASFSTCKSDAITVSGCDAWPPGPTLSSTECAAEVPKMHSEYGKKEGNSEAEAYNEHQKAKTEAAKRIENVKVNLLMLSANYIENSRRVVKGGTSGKFRQSKVMRYFKNLLCDATLSGKTFKKSLLFGWNNFEKALVDASKNVSF